MAGLAWLSRRASKRPITLVVGDLRTGMDNFEARDAAEAAEFILRPDVRILNWYRTDKNKKGADCMPALVSAALALARFSVLGRPHTDSGSRVPS